MRPFSRRARKNLQGIRRSAWVSFPWITRTGRTYSIKQREYYDDCGFRCALGIR